MRGPTSRRWLTFSVSALVLLTGIVVLSGGAAGLAPLPDADDESARVEMTAGDDTDGAVVDQLDTWAETKVKGKVSPAGKGKRKGNDKGRNRLR